MENNINSISIRKYLRERRRQLDCEKTGMTAPSAKRSISSAMAELMFVEEYLNKIDPVGEKMFIEILKTQKIYK